MMTYDNPLSRGLSLLSIIGDALVDIKTDMIAGAATRARTVVGMAMTPHIAVTSVAAIVPRLRAGGKNSSQHCRCRNKAEQFAHDLSLLVWRLSRRYRLVAYEGQLVR